MNVTCNECKCPCCDDTREKFHYNGCNHYINIENPIYDNLVKAIKDKDEEINKLKHKKKLTYIQ